MLRYHVTCGLTKKVVSVDNSDNTLTAILEVFSVGPDAAYILQVLDPEFEDFVDVEDVASLPHLSKLQLLVIGNICNMLHSVCFMNEILIYRLRIGHSTICRRCHRWLRCIGFWMLNSPNNCPKR